MSIRRRLILFVAVAAIGMATAPADAKCALQPYLIEVEVRSSQTQKPLPDVRIIVFANGAEAEMSSRAAPEALMTGPDGKLAQTYLLNAYSGPGVLHADRCDTTLRTLDLVLFHPAHRARRVSVKKVRAVSSSTGEPAVAVIPALFMDPARP